MLFCDGLHFMTTLPRFVSVSVTGEGACIWKELYFASRFHVHFHFSLEDTGPFFLQKFPVPPGGKCSDRSEPVIPTVGSFALIPICCIYQQLVVLLMKPELKKPSNSGNLSIWRATDEWRHGGCSALSRAWDECCFLWRKTSWIKP